MVQIWGTAFDTHLEGWQLDYTGDGGHGWTTISAGGSSVSGGLLAEWDTSTLPACAYTLRLTVSDSAIIDGNNAIRNRMEYTVMVNVGELCPVDS